MADTTRCKTVLVDDNPATEDQFAAGVEVGPHRRVADGIGDLIENGERGGKVIGLEGRWGAGKSTVVTMLRHRFEKHDRVAVVAFDAWAHEGDPLRRTYLETLVNALKGQSNGGWISAEEWDSRLAVLARRRRVTDTRIIPKPTTLGTLFALSLIAVPIGTTFVAAALREGITLSLDGKPAWQFLIGLVTALGPFWVLLGKALKEAVGRRLVRPWFRREDWAFLSGHAIVEQHLETVETPEPTSIEFESDFGKLMEEALGADPGRHVLLILDNLDRVDSDTALRLWSTLQTFLQERQYRQREWFNRLWVLVPYDPVGLKRQWGARSGDEDAGRELAVSFFEKSFQVRFHVSPPILSNWKPYLLRLLCTALPQHDENDLMPICSVYDRFRRHPERFPTPRELKVFVNQVAAIHLQWHHEFPLEHVAYFVVVFVDHGTMIQRLRDGLNDEVRNSFSGDLVDSLAGMTFNVPARTSMELLLGEPIRRALDSRAGKDLAGLRDTHGAGFWAVLVQEVMGVVSPADAFRVARYASTCQLSGLFADDSPAEANVVAEALRRSVANVKAWSVGTLSEAEAFVDMCALVKHPALVEQALSSLRLAVGRSTETDKGDVPPEEFAAACYTVFGGVSKLGYQRRLPDLVAMPSDTDYWTTFARECARVDPAGTWWSKFKPSFNGKDFANSVTTTVTEGRWSESQVAVLLVTHATGVIPDWKGLFKAVRDRLQAEVGASAQEVEHLVGLLDGLRERGLPTAGQVAKELADSGHLLHQIHTLRTTASRSLCLFTYLRERQVPGAPPVVGSSSAGHDAVEKELRDDALGPAFADYLSQRGALDVLWQLVAARGKVDPMVRAALNHVASSGAGPELFTPDRVSEHLTLIQDGLATDGDSTEQFDKILRVCVAGGLGSALMQEEGGFRVERAGVYRSVLLRTPHADIDFEVWVKEQVRSVTREAWAQELEKDGDLLPLALELQARGALASLSTSFLDAVSDASTKTARKVPPDAILKNWEQVLGLVPLGGQRNELADAALRAAIAEAGGVPKEFWESFGRVIDEAAVRRHERVVSTLLVPLVKERNEAGLKWFQAALASGTLVNFLRGQPDFDALEARLRDDLAQPKGDSIDAAVGEIAAALGVGLESGLGEEASAAAAGGDG